ncbi:MAG: hypothetical protein ACLVJH_04165 [Faecalibacterium prausnitzii]
MNAAVQLACKAKQIITRVDLDGPALCSEDPILRRRSVRREEHHCFGCTRHG